MSRPATAAAIESRSLAVLKALDTSAFGRIWGVAVELDAELEGFVDSAAQFGVGFGEGLGEVGDRVEMA